MVTPEREQQLTQRKAKLANTQICSRTWPGVTLFFPFNMINSVLSWSSHTPSTLSWVYLQSHFHPSPALIFYASFPHASVGPVLRTLPLTRCLTRDWFLSPAVSARRSIRCHQCISASLVCAVTCHLSPPGRFPAGWYGGTVTCSEGAGVSTTTAKLEIWRVDNVDKRPNKNGPVLFNFGGKFNTNKKL